MVELEFDRSILTTSCVPVAHVELVSVRSAPALRGATLGAFVPDLVAGAACFGLAGVTAEAACRPTQAITTTVKQPMRHARVRVLCANIPLPSFTFDSIILRAASIRGRRRTPPRMCILLRTCPTDRVVYPLYPTKF